MLHMEECDRWRSELGEPNKHTGRGRIVPSGEV